MTVQLWMIGKTTPLYQPIEALYAKRLTHYTKYTGRVFDEKSAKNRRPEIIRKMEAETILLKLIPADYLILLDEKGTSFSSREFAAKIEKLMVGSTSNVVFLIGGAYGFDDTLRQRANAIYTLSKMTFSHQIARVVFLEQLYRGFTIINNEPYHND